MLPWETLRARDDRRARRRTDLARPRAARRPAIAVLHLAGLLAARPARHRPGRPGGDLGRHPEGHGHSSEHRGQHRSTSRSRWSRRARSLDRPRRPARPALWIRRARPTSRSNQIAIYLTSRPRLAGRRDQARHVHGPDLGHGGAARTTSTIVPDDLDAARRIRSGFPTVGSLYIRLVANVNNAVIAIAATPIT